MKALDTGSLTQVGDPVSFLALHCQASAEAPVEEKVVEARVDRSSADVGQTSG